MDYNRFEKFGQAVDNEIIVISIAPPNNQRFATLTVTNTILKESFQLKISVDERIKWFFIVEELEEKGWL